MKHFFYFGLLLLLLFGCQQTETAKDDKTIEVSHQNNEVAKSKEDKLKRDVDLKKFFKPDQSTAKFLGDGNEFSSYTEKTTWLNDEYVGTIVDNGGSVLMYVYKITENSIELIYREHIDVFPIEKATYPSIEKLKTMNTIEIVLAKPLTVGTTFDGWKIVDTKATVKTPYKTFQNVFVLEFVGEDFINRKYFAEGFGEIKSEFITFPGKEDEFIVTSTLESLEIK